MDISWDAEQFIAQAQILPGFPEEVLQLLSAASNGDYLDTVAGLALDCRFTSAVFVTHSPIFVEICGRWLNQPGADHLLALCALSRVISLRPCLSFFATALLNERRSVVLEALASRKANALHDLPQESLIDLLLALYRLLVFDNAGFAEFFAPAQIQSLFAHGAPHIRYMAVRILGLYLHASDAALGDMIKRYVTTEAVYGQWEGKTIDYTFFSLWEKDRLEQLGRQSEETGAARDNLSNQTGKLNIQRILEPQEFSATTAYIGCVLVPRFHSGGLGYGTFVMTESSRKGLTSFADGLNSTRPLLITGLEGSGKTSMIRHAARMLGEDGNMVVLHLNEQTDAKMLIGMYTSAKDANQFTWKPGVLTKAVVDGRWVIIEDLDRVPTEVLSLLLPLLERRELCVPNWRKSIVANPGFKLIATVCTSEKLGGEELDPSSHLLGRSHWSRIHVGPKTVSELAAIIRQKSPILSFHIPQLMAVYTALRNLAMNSSFDKKLSKPPGPRELLRWSARVEALLLNIGTDTGSESISDTTKDGIFLEAVDCFAAAIPRSSRKPIVEIIAAELQMPPERVTYCLQTRVPGIYESKTVFSIGRVKLSKSKDVFKSGSSNVSAGNGPFAISEYVSQILESIGATANRSEPCLLVGETGTGKTTVLQQLAHALNKRLVVVNLSQQSESGDLLGSFKPTNMRNLAMPMRDEFNELLLLTFSSKANQDIIVSLDQNIAKARWSRVLHIWRKALESIQCHVEAVLAEAQQIMEESRSKKRKVRRESYQQLQPRWDKFAADLRTFEMNLSNGARGFAFSFVEGSVVKAARNGDWVLLDEINLASPDTLESFTDLLYSEYDGRPSLLLSETGNIERIQAHHEFRIFGAMNPATDTGKRDLPPSIRSRFTEIYIDGPDHDLKNLVPLVNAYLGSQSYSDVRLATDTAELYSKIKDLARISALADGSDRKVHFSLRNLSRALSYAVDMAPSYGLRWALYEGLCMTFTTSLNKGSVMLLEPLIKNFILGSPTRQEVILHQTPRSPQDGKRYVQFRHYWIAQGMAPIERNPHYIRTPFVERNLLNLVRASSTRKYPVLLQGPTSSGKTSMVEFLAKVSGNKFIRINNHEHTDLQEYLGSYISGSDGRITYHEGLLVQALREGSWIVLDELNLAPTDVLEALNRLLDDNRELFLPETQQVVRPHENFMLFATQNPPGLYGGRKVLSRAFQNRFLELHFDDLPEDELEVILRERSQIAPSFCKKIVTVYQRLSILRQTTRLFEQRNSFATLRDLFRWALRDAVDREQLAINGFLLLAERVRDAEERKSVKKIIEDVMKVNIDEDQIYSQKRLENSLGSPLPKPQGITWTKSMRRLYVLVTHALENHEPVLLVGQTGLGKTTICQAIAETMNTKIHIVNAHQNMETGDLVGAQRPVRDQLSTQDELIRDYVTALTNANFQARGAHSELEHLEKNYDTLIHEKPEHVPHELQMKIWQNRSKINTLFEWSDSSLVQAMRAGHHYLLDEISLADDSVLERLNSVLEPGRSLLLAEKGTNDVQVSASDAFQFFATMNPGGDYGKRELSPALRNRFTEIWVPNISDEDEMLEIVLAKLPSSRVDLARPMVNFAAWYISHSDATTASLSIRDLLSWAKFVHTFPEAETAFLAFHGAAMVYLDGTRASPTGQTSIAHAEGSRGLYASLQKLSELFCCDIMPLFKARPSLHWKSHQIQIGDFALPRLSKEVPRLKYSLQAPTARLNAMKIVRALQLQKPILLEGSPGVGKTTLVSTLACAVGIPLTRINLSDQTDLIDLFGSDVPVEGKGVGHFAWRDAPFLRAMQNGEWVLLDEMNLAPQTVLEGLNACLDHRGQVYISELNRTFQRHPNFVVFAAQNPQSQGGGRKGLPASFTNRFTTVFAASFISEDLQLICSELFTEVPGEVIKRLIDCLSLLNTYLDDNPILAIHGGPWSLNLRDAFRWLQLLTSRSGLIPFTNPADFVDLLILQRFRSLDDRTSLSKKMKYLDYVGGSRGHYHALSPHALQVGSAILPRAHGCRPLLALERLFCNTSLQNLESIMICVQMNWPCLLVGPIGSGKSTIIRQLASTVGAELVTITLNPDMDTSDLVGGFEQYNTDQEIVAFTERVKNHTEKTIIQNAISASKSDVSSLLELRGRLGAAPTDILQPLQTAANKYPSSIYPEFLQDYQILMERTAVSNRARFEWVDGILVQALKHGNWLVMNNANLCDPSVLDRINSLLEHNGHLSINEHRNQDGSAQDVKASPGFRLFMTMDPRHGELSRAMRNRSVEIFTPIEEFPSPTANVFGLDTEALVARFQYFQMFDWDQYDDIQFVNLMSICLQHLSAPDFTLCSRWEAQILLGLTKLQPSRYELFQSIVSLYQDLLVSNHDVIKRIQDCYLTISTNVGFGDGFSVLQPIHPFNNSILMSSRSHISGQLEYLGHWFDFIVELSFFKQKLIHKPRGTELKKIGTRRNVQDDIVQKIATFLLDLGSCLGNALGSHDFADSAKNEDFLKFANEVMAYSVDLFDSANSASFDEGIFQIFQSIGWSLAAHGISVDQTHGSKQTLAHYLASKLAVFNTSEWNFNSGLAIEHLWSFLKPATATSNEEFEMYMEIELLADRFDTLKWGSGASMHNLNILRDTLIAIHASVNHRDGRTIKQLEKAKKLLDDVETQNRISSGDEKPYFQRQFETLNQFSFIERSNRIKTRQGSLEMLAGKSTKASMAFGTSGLGWHALSQVHLLDPGSQRGAETAMIHRTVLISMILKLYNVDEVPLSALSLLNDEINLLSIHTTQMCSIIGTDVLIQMYRKLHDLRALVIRAFQSKPHVEEVEDLPDVDALRKRLNEMIILAQDRHNPTLSALCKCSTQILDFDPSLSDVTCGITAMQLAKDWIQFFAGLLVLYVPDRPFDPALRLLVKQTRYKKRLMEYKTKLDAMKRFQLSFAGQSSNYRINLLQEGLESLGTAPIIPKVYRPAASKLPYLQNELKSIMKSIILRIPDVYMPDMVPRGNENLQEELEVLKVNIRSASSQLAGDFREYDDIRKPAIAMLQGLDIGVSLAMHAGSQSSKVSKAIAAVCSVTPFMGATPQSVLAQNFLDLENMNFSGLDLRLFILESVAIAKSVESSFAERMRYTMFEAFHSFYLEWREKLSQDQKEKAAESSLYRYRGKDDDNEELDSEDLSQIFQIADSQRDKHISREDLVQNPRAFALRVSHLHREIFQSSGTATKKLLRMVKNVSNHVAKLWSSDGEQSISPIVEENLLPAMIINLNDVKDNLQHSPDRRRIYNFYTDANVVEAKKVVALVQNIQDRFRDLQDVWPEHATLGDVLKASKELLSLDYSVPVSKMLSKAEQLHSFVHEWQMVANREYTAVNLFDQLTNLLISWRRLELSTWAQLLDLEYNKCIDDSDSWWFVAYEIIIATPMSLINGQEDICVYAQQLYTTLEKFLCTSSKGQYVYCLQLLKCFEDHLALLAEEHESLNVIRSSLNNFLRFHHHFEELIQHELREGRKSLERDLKEIIVLASWKDTNIMALQDSAKRSHRKLFKVVRRYRSLLAQTAEDSLQLEIADTVGEQEGMQSSELCAPISKVNLQALEFCQQNWSNWSSTPARLRNSTETAQTMLRLSHYPMGLVDAAGHLNMLVSGIVENMTLLQNETINKATLHDKVPAKHLKTRKRKLLSDTLKAVRQMGFNYNINEDIMKKQGTTAVLSNTPSFGPNVPGELARAEKCLDRLLNIMPRIREHAVKHSNDLTHNEVTKSTGYLESMLFTILKQKNLLVCCAADFAALKKTSVEMKTLWAPEEYTITQNDANTENNVWSLFKRVQWLLNIVESGCIILKTYQKLSESNVEGVLTFLDSWRTSLSHMHDEIANLSKLPPGISSTRHIDVLARCQAMMKAFQDQLKRKEIEYPDLAFIFKQIEIWSEPSDVGTEHGMSEAKVVPFITFTDSISNTVDTILVAVQHLREALNSKTLTSSDARWLLEVDNILSNGLKTLHCRGIDRILRSSIYQIARFNVPDGQTIKLASAVCAITLPIIQQYQEILNITLLRYAKFHLSLCRLALMLAKSFLKLVQEGFCGPKEDSTSTQDNDGKLEEGVGLGEGEGAEDISKGVDDDEDLSELAQKGEKEDVDQQTQDIEDRDDAVNMDRDEMTRENGHVPENKIDEGDSQDGDENEIDDEIGSVDDLDPGSVDEKLWDGKGRNDEKEKLNNAERGKGDEDEIRATETRKMKADGSQPEVEDNKDSDPHQDAADEGEEVARRENASMDPQTLEQSLELPEEMDFDIKDGLDSWQSEDDELTKLSEMNDEKESAVNADQPEEEERTGSFDNHNSNKQEAEHGEDVEQTSNDQEDDSRAVSPVNTDPKDRSDISQDKLEKLLQDRTDEAGLEVKDVASPSEIPRLGHDMDQTHVNDRVEQESAQRRKGAESAFDESNDAQADVEDDKINGSLANNQRRLAQGESQQEESSKQPFKKLGNALEEFHKQLKEILDGSNETKGDAPRSESQHEEFEHLGDDAQGDGTQALGPAFSEQAKPLHGGDMESETEEPGNSHPILDNEDAIDEDQNMDDDRDLERNPQRIEQRARAGAFVGEHVLPELHSHQPSADSPPNSTESMDEMNIDLHNPLPVTHQKASQLSSGEALQLWSEYEAVTKDLSLFLTEQLRLILTPTQATRMRGDFRTGKRLNIKRIIPYVASNFKQDKIWMRRSIPSKLSYQILLALDDSKSMSENGSGQLAYQTLAVMTRSLATLEVGEICIVGFGNSVFVAHEFNAPFTSEAGATVLRHFTFQQEGTNVANLVDRSIGLLREARLKQVKKSQDLLQLELIISDGLCEDHEKIKKLVRQAVEERIMIVFVIVDALLQKNSIVDMNQAVFDDQTGQGKTGVKINRYLDSFPFTYYLVVGDVRDLPKVLAQALRQWFAEVAEV